MEIAPLKGHESILNTFSKGPFRPSMGGSGYNRQLRYRWSSRRLRATENAENGNSSLNVNRQTFNTPRSPLTI